MITPGEIKKRALTWWTPFLRSYVSGEQFFPQRIDRIGKVKPGDITGRFEVLQQEIDLLFQGSKNRTGVGYRICTADRTFRRTGSHELPDSIVFDTIDDYIQFTGKGDEWALFVPNLESLTKAIPSLKSWASRNSDWLIDPSINWANVLKVCLYFMSNPRPNVYIRQLPIHVHTKFIEEHNTLLQSLLNFLIPEDIRNPTSGRFAERYFLRYDEPLVRIRFLDNNQRYGSALSDVSVPLSDFRLLDLPAEKVLITENKMNFLALPALTSTIAVWSGGGFNISHLKDVVWLKAKTIYYWGDIDEHGFQLLHMLRCDHVRVVSMMMDMETFDRFKEFVVDGAENIAGVLSLLTEKEDKLYQSLKLLRPKNRLEQEKLDQDYVDEYLRHFLE